MSREIRSILGYSGQDVMRLTEATSDDLVQAYRELIASAKNGCSLEDIVDAISIFLDVASEFDSDMELETKLADLLRQRVMGDDFRDATRSMLTLVGESRQVGLRESLEGFDADLGRLKTDVQTARDFGEVSASVIGFLGGLRARAPKFACAVEEQVVRSFETFLVALERPMRQLALSADG